MSSILYDGFEFKDKDLLARYVRLKRRLRVFSSIGVVTILPSLFLLFSQRSSYFYLLPLSIGIVSLMLSSRANSKLTEIINSDEVRYRGK